MIGRRNLPDVSRRLRFPLRGISCLGVGIALLILMRCKGRTLSNLDSGSFYGIATLGITSWGGWVTSPPGSQRPTALLIRSSRAVELPDTYHVPVNDLQALSWVVV